MGGGRVGIGTYLSIENEVSLRSLCTYHAYIHIGRVVINHYCLYIYIYIYIIYIYTIMLITCMNTTIIIVTYRNRYKHAP